MSIVALEKITLVTLAEDAGDMIRWLQEQGCAHVIPAPGAVAAEGETTETSRGLSPVSPEVTQSLQFLRQAPRRRRQVDRSRREVARFDAAALQRDALALRDRLQELRARREALRQRIRVLEPWGQFEYPPLDEMAGQRLWFYEVPLRDLPRVTEAAPCLEVVRRTERHAYVVIVAPEEPADIPAPRSHVGGRSLAALVEDLEEIELGIEDVEAERERLSRWTELLARDVDALHDAAARDQARRMMWEDGPVVALQAWVPAGRAAEIEAEAGRRGAVCLREAPGPGDEPPTLLENAAPWGAGEPLVTFYTTPGYRGWDPSGIVFLSFVLFFSMILADAGYGLVLGAVVALAWRRLGRGAAGRRGRILGAALAAGSTGYGMLVGSYFGLVPEPGSRLAALRVLDHTDAGTMMRLCIVIGALHVILGCLMESRRHGWKAVALAPLGWAGFVGGGAVAAAGKLWGDEMLFRMGAAVGGAGLAGVFLFAGAAEPTRVQRWFRGLTSLSGVTSAFGDVLSYLRLFALGLAGSSLASTFNDLAGQIRGAVPGVGLLLALLVVIPGHALNLLLGIVGGFIHGLRLNVIEFFNWSLKTEGTLFTPLRSRAPTPWNIP
jgi:V/A-type H+-transporting ATPase subunit I